MTNIPALGPSLRVPSVEIDEDGTPYFRVPLDDRGENYALVDWQDFDHITLTLGCRAAWYYGGARGRRQYVRVNVPHVEGREGGLHTVVRLFPGIGPTVRVEYATTDTLNLCRSNLVVKAIQDGSNLDSGKLTAAAVQKREAVQKRAAAEKKRLRSSRIRHYSWDD
jgi:hypothetical protein